MTEIMIREMTEADWAEVARIHQQGIDTRHCTFLFQVPPYEIWHARHLDCCRLVAEAAGQVIGWVALSPFNSSGTYAGVAEISIYIEKAYHGRGVGTRLLQAMIEASEAAGIWMLQSVVFANNAASLALHKKCGFRVVGRREKINRDQDGVWQDTYLLERRSRRVGWQQDANEADAACLICGAPLEYATQTQERQCVLCGRSFHSNAACSQGHFVCDECHKQQAVAVIHRLCLETRESDAVAIARLLMAQPEVHLHGPEHHILVGAALLAAYRNAGGEVDLGGALRELTRRARTVPGGACGFWGVCGAAVSVGMFMSIVTGATPLSRQEWRLSNQLTAAALAEIAQYGGPRCCKRDSFLAIRAAIAFVRENLGVAMEQGRPPRCDYSAQNKECLGGHCPFHASGGAG